MPADSELSQKVTSILCDPNVENVLFSQLKNVIKSPNNQLEVNAGEENKTGSGSHDRDRDISPVCRDATSSEGDGCEQCNQLETSLSVYV